MQHSPLAGSGIDVSVISDPGRFFTDETSVTREPGSWPNHLTVVKKGQPDFVVSCIREYQNPISRRIIDHSTEAETSGAGPLDSGSQTMLGGFPGFHSVVVGTTVGTISVKRQIHRNRMKRAPCG